MKPPTQPAASISSQHLDRAAVESVVRQATRAAAPDYYVQKATGRALTKLVTFVIVLQVGGVFLWLVLVFAGLVDASQNLDTFMVSQLVVFLGSLVVGLGAMIYHLKGLRLEAQQLEPGVATRMLQLLDVHLESDDSDRVDQLCEQCVALEEIAEQSRPERVFSGHIAGREYQMMDLRRPPDCCEGGREGPRGLMLTFDIPVQLQGQIAVEPAGDGTPRGNHRDGWREFTTGDEQFDEMLAVYTTDPKAAVSVLDDRAVREAFQQFYEEARRRDQREDAGDGAGDFTAVLAGEEATVIRRSPAPLFPADADADEASVDGLLASADEVQSAVGVVEAIDQLAS